MGGNHGGGGRQSGSTIGFVKSGLQVHIKLRDGIVNTATTTATIAAITITATIMEGIVELRSEKEYLKA